MTEIFWISIVFDAALLLAAIFITFKDQSMREAGRGVSIFIALAIAISVITFLKTAPAQTGVFASTIIGLIPMVVFSGLLISRNQGLKSH